MAALLSPETLAKWTQSELDEILADPFALDVIDKVSALICYIGGHDGKVTGPDGFLIPEWTLENGPNQAPVDILMIALKVIKRSYENPEQVLQAGSIGPLGGDRVADVQALFMDFTDEERATIARHNPNGDPSGPGDGAGEIFTLSITREDAIMPSASPLYMGDDQQINLDISPDPREWMIPMFNPGDPGDDSRYV